MLDHDARWLTCCVLLADPNRGSRALIAELNRWPSKNTRHHPSDATPEGWPSASAIERWHRENPGAWRRSKPEATSEAARAAIDAPAAATQVGEASGGVPTIEAATRRHVRALRQR